MPHRRPGIRRNTTAVWIEHARLGTPMRGGDGQIGFAYDPGWLA